MTDFTDALLDGQAAMWFALTGLDESARSTGGEFPESGADKPFAHPRENGFFPSPETGGRRFPPIRRTGSKVPSRQMAQSFLGGIPHNSPERFGEGERGAAPSRAACAPVPDARPQRTSEDIYPHGHHGGVFGCTSPIYTGTPPMKTLPAGEPPAARSPSPEMKFSPLSQEFPAVLTDVLSQTLELDALRYDRVWKE